MYLLSLLVVVFMLLTPTHVSFSYQNCSPTEDYQQIAQTRFDERDYQASLEAWNCLVELQPDNTHALLSRATTRFWLYDLDAALADVDQFLQLAGENNEPISEGLLLRAAILKYAGRYDEVFELESMLIRQIEAEHEPPLSDELIASVYSVMGEVYVYQNQPTEAINALDTAIQLDEESAWSFFWRGIAHEMMGNVEQAQHDRQESLRLAPDIHTRMRQEGSIYSNLGNYEQAVQFFTYAIETSDEEIWSYYAQRGLAYFELDEFENAVNDFDTVFELNPEEYQLRFFRGCALVELGEITRAVTDLSRYITINPQFPDTYLCRANAYYANGNEGRALRNYLQYQQLAEQSGTEVNPLAAERIEELSD